MDRSPTTAEVAQRVAAAIRAHGVTQTWLCATTGIPRVTLHRRLNGLSSFNLNELDRIADALRVPVATFLLDEAKESA